MALADVAVDVSEPFVHQYSDSTLSVCEDRFRLLQERALDRLQDQGVNASSVTYECYLNLQYQGSDTTLMIGRPSDNDFAAAFVEAHKREFAFISDSQIVVAGVRVRATSKTVSTHLNEKSPYMEELESLRASDLDVGSPQAFAHNAIYFEELGSFSQCPLYKLGDLIPGMVVSGPAIILDNTQTIVLHPQNTARILRSHVLSVKVSPPVELQADLSALTLDWDQRKRLISLLSTLSSFRSSVTDSWVLQNKCVELCKRQPSRSLLRND